MYVVIVFIIKTHFSIFNFMGKIWKLWNIQNIKILEKYQIWKYFFWWGGIKQRQYYRIVIYHDGLIANPMVPNQTPTPILNHQSLTDDSPIHIFTYQRTPPNHILTYKHTNTNFIQIVRFCFNVYYWYIYCWGNEIYIYLLLGLFIVVENISCLSKLSQLTLYPDFINICKAL